MSAVDANPDLEAQRRYAKRMVAEGYDFGLTHGEAFVRGIRDLGYKSTATAIDELIDNSEQAGAQQVHVFFDDFGRDPTWLAVADDGHGMVPEMIRLAVIWGGTHRENDRKGFGRYGWGLPSASVSIGRRFTVYSWTSGSRLVSNGNRRPGRHRGGPVQPGRPDRDSGSTPGAAP